MKYKITQIRERPHVINGDTIQFIKVWYEVPLLQYKGIIEMPKEHFEEGKLVKKIKAEVKTLMDIKNEGELDG